MNGFGLLVLHIMLFKTVTVQLNFNLTIYVCGNCTAWYIFENTCNIGCVCMKDRWREYACQVHTCTHESYFLSYESFLLKQCMCICFALNALVRFAILHQLHSWGCLCVLGCMNYCMFTCAVLLERPDTCLFHITSWVISDCSKLSTCVHTYKQHR